MPPVPYFLCLRSWVHPRLCGEYFIAEKPSVAMEGSPPLTRGIRAGLICYLSHLRFTPAHAGNTKAGCQDSITAGVHPRSRGEYVFLDASMASRRGSPPLTRGILASVPVYVCFPGFTPAHAGNTKSQFFIKVPAKVHPRSRGEYPSIKAVVIFPLGSPPLTRGIPLYTLFFPLLIRFTPAHAGNTAAYINNFLAPQVHPRSRGEYQSSIWYHAPIQGSPPLTRGIQ